MNVFAAVDPGVRGCGVAVFEGNFLVAAAYVVGARGQGPARAAAAAGAARAVVEWLVGKGVEGLVVEWPQVYATRIRRGARGGDPNDLLPLAGVVAAVAAVVGGVRTTSYLPVEWKGQMPKDVCRQRVADRLSPAEQFYLDQAGAEAGAEAHNVWDAVGLGLHHLGRLAPRKGSRARDGGGEP